MRRAAVLILLTFLSAACTNHCTAQPASMTRPLDRALPGDLAFVDSSILPGGHTIQWGMYYKPLYDVWFRTIFETREGPIEISQAIERRKSEFDSETRSSRNGDDRVRGKKSSTDDIERISKRISLRRRPDTDGVRFRVEFIPSKKMLSVDGLHYESYGNNLVTLASWAMHKPDGYAAFFVDDAPVFLAEYKKGRLNGYCAYLEPVLEEPKDGEEPAAIREVAPKLIGKFRMGRLVADYAFHPKKKEWVETTDIKSPAANDRRDVLKEHIRKAKDHFDKVYQRTGGITKEIRRDIARQNQAAAAAAQGQAIAAARSQADGFANGANGTINNMGAAATIDYLHGIPRVNGGYIGADGRIRAFITY